MNNLELKKTFNSLLKRLLRGWDYFLGIDTEKWYTSENQKLWRKYLDLQAEGEAMINAIGTAPDDFEKGYKL